MNEETRLPPTFVFVGVCIALLWVVELVILYRYERARSRMMGEAERTVFRASLEHEEEPQGDGGAEPLE